MDKEKGLDGQIEENTAAAVIAGGGTIAPVGAPIEEEKMGLREAAAIAWQRARVEQAAVLAERREREKQQTRNAFVKMFGQQPETVEGYIAKANGLTLRYRIEGYRSPFQLRGECWTCGRECWSGDITSLAELGEQLASFQVAPDHVCSQPNRTPTWEERLAALLDERYVTQEE